LLRDAPLGVQPALFFEPVERRIERPFLDLQLAARDLFDGAEHAKAVRWTPGERLEHEEIESTGQQLDDWSRHGRTMESECSSTYLNRLGKLSAGADRVSDGRSQRGAPLLMTVFRGTLHEDGGPQQSC